LKIDGGAVISAAVGSVGFLLGILSIPLMLDAAKTNNPGIADYVFGGCFVLLFVVVGGSFAWNGFSAMFRGISLDHEQEPEERRKREKE